MAATTKPKTSRERQRAKGLKPETLSLPDVNDPEIRAQLVRDWQLISRSEDERDVLDLLDSLTDEQLRELDEIERE